MKPLAAVLLLIAGCAQVQNAGMQIASSSASAVVLINERLLHGKVVFFTNRTGNLKVSAGLQDEFQCAGPLRYTATETGVLQLHCNDGTEVTMNFTALGETRGFGQGPLARGVASWTYGMAPEQAAAYLKPPAGKRLVPGPLGLSLQAP
ncbi:MAG: hypothetical protein OEY75_02890 [Hylemonella sp.]|nr:hypothetical protein [Hylemonella sp.]